MTIQSVNSPNTLAIKAVVMLLTASSLVMSSPAMALALTLITDRSALRANDSLNFSSLERIFNPFAPTNGDSFLPNTFSAISDNGLELSIDIAPSNDSSISPPFIFQTTSPPGGIPTNFTDGDFILFTGADFRTFPAPGNSSPVTINFAIPVTGAGTQIAVDDTLSFIASISAFDDDGNLLSSFSVPGTSSTALDDSALFLGVASESANIARLVYSTSVSSRAIGINTVSISNGTAIPEPAAFFGLLAVTILSIFGFSKRKYFRSQLCAR